MNRAVALALPLAAAIRIDSVELTRRAIVLACGAALIFAGQSLPL